MREVVIEYPFLKFWNKKIRIDVPQSWNDMNVRQFSICARVHVEPVSDIDFLSIFFGIKKRMAKRFSQFQQYKLIELAGFTTDPKVMANRFFIERIPILEMQAPAEKLEGVNMEQFIFFDTFFFDYLNSKKEEDLQKFIAALYLKEKEVITRIDFNSRINAITRKIDKATQYAIFLNYIFIRRWLAKAFPYIFGFSNEQEGEVKTRRRKAKPIKKNNRPDWISILDGFIGDDVVNYDRYKLMSCTLVFRLINKRIASYKKKI